VTLLEPAPYACQAARERGLRNVIEGYLTPNTFLGEYFDALIIRHVLEHVSNPIAFLTLLREHLSMEGILFIEVPNLDAIVIQERFQDFYVEHLSYFNPQSLNNAVAKSGFNAIELYTIENLDYLVCVAQVSNNSLTDMITNLPIFRNKLQSLVKESVAQGRRVGVWGAGGRGIALLALISADNIGITYVIDSDSKKWGRYTPGTHLPVVSPEILHNDPVDDLLITVLSFQDEIIHQLRWFLTDDRRVGVLLPNPHWLEKV
jgi:hypothetical protein